MSTDTLQRTAKRASPGEILRRIAESDGAHMVKEKAGFRHSRRRRFTRYIRNRSGRFAIFGAAAAGFVIMRKLYRASGGPRA